MILNGLPWKQTEIILSFLRLHPRYCITDSFVDHDGYSISSEGAVAVRAQEGLEELSHIEGQEGQR